MKRIDHWLEYHELEVGVVGLVCCCLFGIIANVVINYFWR